MVGISCRNYKRRLVISNLFGILVSGIRSSLRAVISFKPSAQSVDSGEKNASGNIGLVELIADFPFEAGGYDDPEIQINFQFSITRAHSIYRVKPRSRQCRYNA